MILSKRIGLCFPVVLAMIAACFVQPAFAFAVQVPAEAKATDEIAELRAELESVEDPDADAKKQIQDLLNSAEESQKKRAELVGKLKEISERPDVAKTVNEITQQLQKLKQGPAVESKLADIQPDDQGSVIIATNDAVKKLKESVAAIDLEINRRSTRRGTVRTQTADLNEQIAQTQRQLDSLDNTDVSLRQRSSALALRERLLKLTRESEIIQAETARFELEESNGHLQKQRELADAKLKQSQEFLAGLEKIRADQMKLDATTTKEKAKKQEKDIKLEFKELVSSYELNTEFANLNTEAADKLSDINSRKTSLIKKQDDLQKEFRDTKAMIDRIGLSGSVGALLRKTKSDLPNSQSSLLAANRAKAEADEVQFGIFEIDRELAALSSDSVKQEIVAAGFTPDAKRLKELESPIESLITSRRDLLAGTRTNLNTLFKSLVEIEFANRTLASVSTKFRNYINERILWIRSNKLLFSELTIDESDLNSVAQPAWKFIDESDLTAVSPSAWKITMQRFQQLIVGNPFLFGLIGFVVAILFVIKRPMRNQVIELGKTASRGSCDTFWPTFKTLFATFLIAMTVPVIFLAIGLWIHNSEFHDGISLISALGAACIAVASFGIPVEFLRRMCRENGLAHQHFSWSDDAVRILKLNLDWLSPIGGMITFGIVLLQRLDLTHRIDLSERLLFVAGMGCVSVFLYRSLHPKTGVFHEYLNEREKSWAAQTSAAWFFAIVLTPLMFGVLAIVGYYYTALNLMECVFATFVFAVIGETLRSLLLRYILVQRRHVHIEASKRKRQLERELREKERAANKESSETSQTAEAAQRLEAAGVTEALIDVDVDINAGEANRLISLGMWLVWGIALLTIWSDVLPALKALETPIFPTAVASADDGSEFVIAAEPSSSNSSGDKKAGSSGESATGIIPGADTASAESTSTVESDISRVTYRDLLIFLVIGAITIAVARSLPSTLEMIFLNHLPMDRSVRYAIKSLISYGVVLIGVMLAFRALQIGWSNVQWLATALTFGLAFGLQEIFANFVAGIILMFERPMRIGDWITIGEYSGTVSRIRTRATTLISLDRKEFVVPNKDFIIGRLVNWTLSDAINRVDITVGVAYGSNVKLAKQVLLKICSDHPKVVNDPATTVIFNEFGESSLNLVVRAFVSDIECRMAVIDDLHTLVNDAFIDAGIEISFPQRDLHIRTASPALGDALQGTNSRPVDRNGEPEDTHSSAAEKQKN